MKPTDFYRFHYKDTPTNYVVKSYSKPKHEPKFLLEKPEAALIKKLTPKEPNLQSSFDKTLQTRTEPIEKFIKTTEPRTTSAERVSKTTSPYSSLNRTSSGRTTHLRSNQLKRDSQGNIKQGAPLGSKIKELINKVNNAKQIADNRSSNWLKTFKWAYKRQ
ncbi:MAG: hypothetical protein PF569_00245 [Candidatus Woesearchaeota archaeon]|jgi:hypothetical protein|nr:hypothetical protein [Candidatus Woesearchaeota archaeon]